MVSQSSVSRQVKFYDGPAQDWLKRASRAKKGARASGSGSDHGEWSSGFRRQEPPSSHPSSPASEDSITGARQELSAAVGALLPKRSDNKELGSGLPCRRASQGSRQVTRCCDAAALLGGRVLENGRCEGCLGFCDAPEADGKCRALRSAHGRPQEQITACFQLMPRLTRTTKPGISVRC